MSLRVQEFSASLAEKAAKDLEAALLRLPDDKKNWSPMGNARSAANQVAECAILNASTADLIASKHFDPNFDFAGFQAKLEALAADPAAALALLAESTPKATAAIRAATDEDLQISIDMPWGAMTLAQVIYYPYWNMSYHEGQINYIASMIGCL